MKQLPIFANLHGQNVVLVGDGPEADAKRRLIERAGGICVPDCPNNICKCARIAFVAIEDEDIATATAQKLRGKGMLVNVVDRPALCDFTTPAIVDRDPILLAISTGGASAGMAKAIRQRIEAMMPQNMGLLAKAMAKTRAEIKARWTSPSDRRRAIDTAFQRGGALDPFAEYDDAQDAVSQWIAAKNNAPQNGVITVDLLSNDPEDLTLRHARLLGEADHIFYDSGVSSQIISRARADAQRHMLSPSQGMLDTPPQGLCLYLRLR